MIDSRAYSGRMGTRRIRPSADSNDAHKSRSLSLELRTRKPLVHLTLYRKSLPFLPPARISSAQRRPFSDT